MAISRLSSSGLFAHLPPFFTILNSNQTFLFLPFKQLDKLEFESLNFSLGPLLEGAVKAHECALTGGVSPVISSAVQHFYDTPSEPP